MRLSRASYYALQAVGYLATEGNGEPLTSEEIGKKLGISDRFLLKVLQPLVTSGVLAALRGPNGGYRLARKPAEISMLDVIEPTDPSALSSSVPTLEKGWKMDANVHKHLGTVCDQTAEALRERLGNVTLADLLSRKKL